MRKTFYLKTSSDKLAAWFGLEDSSALIFAEPLRQIEALGKQSSCKGRYIDLANFRNVGAFIDWRGLIAAAAKRVQPRVPGCHT